MNKSSRSCLQATTTVYEGKRILSTSDAPAFVVIAGARPIGVISAERLRTQPSSPRRTVADVMDFDTVAVDHHDDVVDTMRAFEQAGWASLRRRRPFGQPRCRNASTAVGSVGNT